MESEIIVIDEDCLQQLSTNIFDKICRACLSSTEIARMYEMTYENISLIDIFNDCISIQVERSDNLPQNLCTTCANILVQIYTFKKQCQQSEFLLQTVLNNRNQNIASENNESVNNTVQDSIKIEIKKHTSDMSDTVSVTYEDQSDISDYLEEFKVEIKDENNIDNSGFSNSAVETLNEDTTDLNDNPTLYVCSQCDETYESLINLKQHRKEAKHPKLRDYKCMQCQKNFSHSHLKQHMRTHTKEKPFQCTVCLTQFSMKCNLQRHMKIHTGERPYTCHICGKGFIQAGSLQEHIRIHTGEAPFICSYCGISMKRASQLKSHLRKHLIENGQITEAPNTEWAISVQCNECNKFFTTKGALKMHLLTHGEKTILCSDCGKGFVSRAGLVSHMKIHTGLKPYPCNTCKKSFSQVGSLKSHLLIHTGEKPFKCKICGKAFTQRNHLKYHSRIHSGEKPYACTFCDKSFALNGTLTVHLRTHTGETPYVCDICKKGFYDSSSMKKHRRGHQRMMEIYKDNSSFEIAAALKKLNDS